MVSPWISFNIFANLQQQVDSLPSSSEWISLSLRLWMVVVSSGYNICRYSVWSNFNIDSFFFSTIVVVISFWFILSFVVLRVSIPWYCCLATVWIPLFVLVFASSNHSQTWLFQYWWSMDVAPVLAASIIWNSNIYMATRRDCPAHQNQPGCRNMWFTTPFNLTGSSFSFALHWYLNLRSCKYETSLVWCWWIDEKSLYFLSLIQYAESVCF